MSYVIALTRADALRQGDVILAQHTGLLGPWRIVETSYAPSVETHDGGTIQLRLVSQGDTSQPPLMQMHRERSLVPVLVPLPEPVAPDHPGQVVLRSGRLEVRLLDE